MSTQQEQEQEKEKEQAILPDIRHLADHLMVAQRVSMLDTTKCSTTARRVYDYLCAAGQGQGQGSTIAPNDNLAAVAPNLAALRPSASAGDFVAYVHFDHMTNDTSHYFIVVRSGPSVLVLQSAVFEFSLRDWLFPDEARMELHAATAAERMPGMPGMSGMPGMPGMSEEVAAFVAEQAGRDRKRGDAILDSIAACRWGGGKTATVEEFEAEFLPALASLEGVWAEREVPERAAVYRRLFACRLQEDVVRSVIRNGFDKPAAVKISVRDGGFASGGACPAGGGGSADAR